MVSFKLRKKGIFVAWRWEKDRVLINYCNKDAKRGIVTLDPISSVVWEKLIEGKSTEKILKDVTQKFKIPEKEAKRNINKLIDYFMKNEFIEERK